jgi:uncharacterized protein (UPF0261 family)
MKSVVAIIGALDTKGPDIDFLRAQLTQRGCEALVIDTSVMGDHACHFDVSCQDVAQAGGRSIRELRELGDRGTAMQVMQAGAVDIVRRLYEQGAIAAVLGIGGGAGTSIGAAAMRALPLGVPKVMITTMASGQTSQYVQDKDIVLFPSIVDVAGINRVSAGVYARAAGALVGMLQTDVPDMELKPLVAATMFGNTTAAVERCKQVVEAAGGHEVLVFHATGTGGGAMESLIREGFFEGVLDVTTTELADLVAGGVMPAAPERLTEAGRKGIPQVISVGCLDMVNFWGPDTVPEKYRHRRFYPWNPNVTLMRTDPAENALLGRMLAQKANASAGPVAVFMPLRGVSMLDAPGKEFWWPAADEALRQALRAHLEGHVELVEMDNNINDEAFADAMAGKLLEFLARRPKTERKV